MQIEVDGRCLLTGAGGLSFVLLYNKVVLFVSLLWWFVLTVSVLRRVVYSSFTFGSLPTSTCQALQSASFRKTRTGTSLTAARGSCDLSRSLTNIIAATAPSNHAPISLQPSTVAYWHRLHCLLCNNIQYK
jgi:hypothetical protein